MTTSPAVLAEQTTSQAGGRRRWRLLAAKLASVALVFAAAAGLIAVLTASAAGRAPNPVVAPAELAEPAVAVAEDEPSPTATSSTAKASRSDGPSHPADPTWLAQVAAATAIPARALAGYASATIALTQEQPSCGLSWNTLAAIGAVESGHGGHQDAHLLDSGLTSSPIRGPALVGIVRDTDDGEWDGDRSWDRAVGPMQFIPSTWRRWGADGNGDGTSDPNQIDDAALAAGRYLCASGSLHSASGWRAAIYSYNHSDAYVDKIAAMANSYAAASNGAYR